MELRFGITIFIIASFPFEATTSTDFALFSIEKISNFLTKLQSINGTFSNNNSTNNKMRDTSIVIQQILLDTVKNGIDLYNIIILYDWELFIQSVEINKVLDKISNDVDFIGRAFKEKFLPFLSDLESTSQKYQAHNRSQRIDQNFIVNDLPKIVSGINQALYKEIYSNKSILLEMLVDELNVVHARCTHKINYQLLLAQFLEFVIKAELQVMTMVISMHKLLEFPIAPNSEEMRYLERNNFIIALTGRLEKVKNSLKKLSTELYNCGNINHEAFLSEVHIIDLLPINVDYSSNKLSIRLLIFTRIFFLKTLIQKVIVEIGLEVRNRILTLRVTEAPILPYGEILEDMNQKQVIFSKNIDYWGLYNDVYSEFDESCPTVEDVTKDFWRNVKFLPTSVPKNCVVVGAKIEVLPLNAQRTRLIYLRLQYSHFNPLTGTINQENIKTTKLWEQDDPELLKVLNDEATDGSFKKNIEIPDTDERGNREIGKLHGDFRTRIRQERYINYRVDRDTLSSNPLQPLTGISFWKSNIQNKNIYYLSLKASSYDVSDNIDI